MCLVSKPAPRISKTFTIPQKTSQFPIIYNLEICLVYTIEKIKVLGNVKLGTKLNVFSFQDV